MARAKHYDVVIIGGAVMGSAVAHFLTSDPTFDGSILVIERDPSYERCSTGRSWGGVRQQFSTAENIRMSLFGVEFVRTAAERLAVDGEAPDVGFREAGYLYLASTNGRAVLEKNTALQGELGASTVLLESETVAQRFPWLNVEDIAAATFGESGEGWVDAYALMRAFRRKAQADGALYLSDEVIGFERSGPKLTGVKLAGGESVGAGYIVNAAGPHAGALARLADIELPVTPRKRMTYVFDCRGELPPLPLTIDTTGVAFRPEGPNYIAIVSPPADRDPVCPDLDEDYTLFEEIIWPALAHRVPAFEAIKPVGAWAGHYDYNGFDQNAILGPHPEIGGLLFCNGFSGHGLQQSPAAGRAIAELIVHGAYRSLDLSRFSYDRLAQDRPLFESNVV
jgi:glycine/D-amino acid oxidase-like deaminating enzyme